LSGNPDHDAHFVQRAFRALHTFKGNGQLRARRGRSPRAARAGRRRRPVGPALGRAGIDGGATRSPRQAGPRVERLPVVRP
jgi:hypothetical protein